MDNLILLDTKKIYSVRDAQENIWIFKYGKDVITSQQGWFAHMIAPGSEIVQRNGNWPERKIYDLLVQHAHVLDEDDEIDFHLWLEHDGLENLFASLREAAKPPKSLSEIMQSMNRHNDEEEQQNGE